jgi:hypothetical protein
MTSLGVKSFLCRSAAVLSLALLASCGGSSVPLVFSATLTGAEETPPNPSQGRGIGVLTFNPNDRTFEARLASTGVADTDAHIHQGPPGVAGPIVIPLTKQPGSAIWRASGTLTAEQEATLRAGNIDYYFNIHSPTFPQGEIRGQIERRALSPEQQQRVEQLLQQLGTQVQLRLQQITAPSGVEGS